MQILNWVIILLAIPILAWLVKRVVRNAKDLNERIDEYHREQEAMEKLRQQGLARPINPFAEMAELYKEEAEKDKKK